MEAARRPLTGTEGGLSPRRVREREVIAAARRLFDERGLQDAPMEQIAREVGITRTLIYRLFESKEELFVLTVTSYLDELTERGLAAIDRSRPPAVQLRASWENFADYCLAHPAFLDCALSLMRRPARELRERVSDTTWFRLGQSMSRCLAVTIEIVRDGTQRGVFAVSDPELLVNCLYAQTLGIMHVARVGIGVREAAPGVPATFEVDPRSVREACVQAALLAVEAA